MKLSHFLWLIINFRTLYLNTKAKAGIFLTLNSQKVDGKVVNYGYMWRPADEGAYLAIGIFGPFIYVHPRSKTVIAIWSAQPKPEGTNVIDEFVFFNAVVDTLP